MEMDAIPAMGRANDGAFRTRVKLRGRGVGETRSHGKARLGGGLSMVLGDERLGRARRARSRKREWEGGCLPSLSAREDAPGGVSDQEEARGEGGHGAHP